VCSFGTNSQVKMPGPSADRPNTYSFAQSYEHMYGDLKTKDADLYTQNGMLSILERNKKLKEKPQRFQAATSTFDVIFTCEERCFDIVCENLRDREPRLHRPVHVVNFDIPDTPEDAAIGARWILQLAQLLEDSQDLDEEIEGITKDFQNKSPLPMLYSVHYY
jgi:RNA polymerase II subunit A C-terminal domain phosphatase SSU72